MLIIFMVISIALAHPEIQVTRGVGGGGGGGWRGGGRREGGGGDQRQGGGGSPPAQYKLRKRDRGSTLHS